MGHLVLIIEVSTISPFGWEKLRFYNDLSIMVRTPESYGILTMQMIP
jgi:hypothetical protein